MNYFLLPLLLASAATWLTAAEFSAKIVDGLNRPIHGALVDVEIACLATQPDGHSSVLGRLQLSSGEDGWVRGEYPTPPTGCDANVGVEVGKEGYRRYSTGGRDTYVLDRLVDPDEVHRVAALPDDARKDALRELLASDMGFGSPRFRDLVFYYERTLRPVLRVLAEDPPVAERARRLLCLIGDPGDLRFLVDLAPTTTPGGFPDRWRYWIVTALVDPDTEAEWSLLRRAALNEFDDRWVDAGAIQSLKLISSDRSRRILQEAQGQNTWRASRIAQALEYAASSPPALEDNDLENLAARVADTIKLGTRSDNDPPRFNEAGDKALIDFHFHSGWDGLTYTATFDRTGTVWRFRGARETLQVCCEVGPEPPPAPSNR